MKFIVRHLYCVLFFVILLSQSDAQTLSGGPKIQGPWLWVIAPTSLNNVRLGGAAAAISGIDFLSHASNGVVTDLQHVIDYLDDPITGAAPALQSTMPHPKGKLVTTWARLKGEYTIE